MIVCKGKLSRERLDALLEQQECGNARTLDAIGQVERLLTSDVCPEFEALLIEWWEELSAVLPYPLRAAVRGEL